MAESGSCVNSKMGVWQRLFWLWRIMATALAYTLFGIGGLLVPLVAAPVLYLLPGGQLKRQRRARLLVHLLFKAFVRVMKWLGILRWRTNGLDRLGREGLLVLANHPTLLDIVFLVSFIPNATCIVKSRLKSNPAMRGFIALTGYIANDGGPGLVEDARQALARGSCLIIFPEGTRTTAGQPLRMQRGSANIAVRCQQSITPVTISVAPPTLSKEHKWYHIPDRPFVMSFTVKEDIPVTPYAGPPAQEARKLTRHLEHYFTEETRHHGQRCTQ